MSKKRNKGNQQKNPPIKTLGEQLAEIEYKKEQLLQKALLSKDPDTLLKANMMYSQQQFPNTVNANNEFNRKAILLDPSQIVDSLGYRDKRQTVTYDTLRNMAKSPIIKSVIETRIEQVAAYSQVQSENRKSGWMIRRKLNSSEELSERQIEADKKIIESLTNFLLNGGSIGDNWNSDDFEVFLRKTTRDSLVLDQMVYDIVRNRKQTPVEFQALDSATFRLSDNYTNTGEQRLVEKGGIKYLPKYVQLIQGQVYAEFYPWELCFGIRNHNTRLLTNGYGRSELEDMVKIVTWMLYGDQYNGNFFCIHKDSLITTDNGLFPIKELENKEFKIWNGLTWEKAKAFKTEKKDIVRTKLKNGIELKTSPDHRFFIIPKDSIDGEVKEVKQKDLREGDFCILDNKVYKSDFDYNSLGIDEVDSKLDIIPNIILQKLSKLELKSKTGNRKIKLDIEGLLKYNNISRTKIINIFNINNIEIPDILKYSYCPIDTLDKEKIGEDIMYEIEVFDNKHLYFANFIAVHNSQGAAPKGIMRIQGNVNDARLAEFKQQWKAQIAGVSNCLHGDTTIYTKEFGGDSLKEIVGDKKEVPATIWTGKEWATGLVYKTEEKKQLAEIITDNGSVKCSPDHKFMILNDEGEKEWKKQSELNIGDYILTSKLPIENKDQDKIKYRDSIVGEDLFEVLGWIIGDGYISNDNIRFVFNDLKENTLFNKYYQILLDYGIECHQNIIIITEEQRKKNKEYFNLEEVPNRIIDIEITDINFIEWYLNLGFKRNRKEIPSFLYTYFLKEKSAFIKGLKLSDSNCYYVDRLGDSLKYLLSTEDIKDKKGVILIKDLKIYDEFVDMYDVSINTEEHAFVLNINVLNHNSWKTPIIEADKMDYVDLQKSNQDMQFAQWQEYLVRLSCAMYKIDPAEIGFLQNGGSNASQLFEASQQSKIKYSQERGLMPLLKFQQSKINKYLISQLNPDFEFIFTGLENEDEQKELAADISKLGNFMSLKEIRRKRGLPEEIEEGDMIFNSIYYQMKMAEQQSQLSEQDSWQQEDTYPPEEEQDQEDVQKGFELGYEIKELDKREEDNPFKKEFDKWIDVLIHKDK